jgi:hypothetical protein
MIGIRTLKNGSTILENVGCDEKNFIVNHELVIAKKLCFRETLLSLWIFIYALNK